MQEKKSILFCADASPDRGAGHFMRSFALASYAQSFGLNAKFTSAITLPWVKRKIYSTDISLIELNVNYVKNESHSDFINYRIRGSNPGWIVLDGYHFDLTIQRAAKNSGANVLVIDDYNHLPEYHCDILLNQNVSAEKFEYKGNISKKLLGTDYALLRPEFLSAELTRRRFSEKPEKVLITLGGGDFSEHLLNISQILAEFKNINLSVLAGGMEPDKIRKIFFDSGLEVEIIKNIDNLSEIFASIDLCITAGGSTCWELARMGAPFLTIEIAENQRGICEWLSKNNYAPYFSASALHKFFDPETRKKASQNLTRLIDGKGVERVFQAIQQYDKTL